MKKLRGKNKFMAFLKTLTGGIFFLLWVGMIFISPSFALDADLANLPLPAGSKLIWKDKAMELNGIVAPTLRFQCSLPAGQIKNFYQQALAKEKWEIREAADVGNTLLFSKKDKLLSIFIFEAGQGSTNEVYIIKSGTDIALCNLLKDSLFQPKLTPDLPGKDLPDILRYPGSKRRMNLFAPYEGALMIYEAEANPQEIVQFYRTTLNANGWQEERAISQQAEEKLPAQYKEGMAVLCFHRHNDSVVIEIFRTKEAGSEKFSKRTLIVINRNAEQLAYPVGGQE